MLEGGPIMTVAKESNLTAMEQKSKIIAPNDSSPIYLSEKNPKLNDVNGQSPWCHYYLCLCTHTCARASARVEGRVWESALSGPKDGSQAIMTAPSPTESLPSQTWWHTPVTQHLAEKGRTEGSTKPCLKHRKSEQART